ncbi:MAG TPA: nicotinate (nicotinamide) nucleotide adenylyltransferase [Saprospiraceae bacterium]|nr:nicotinate (nicotinamide) nucleotide adenylyltransferase [Saprospiraceae bacterium]
MATIGLLFGSFNPIHTGHLIIAEYFATREGCDHVDLVVSPQNPLKKSKDLADEKHRLAMARLSVRGNPLIQVNAIEFSLPRPSYTYHTLSQLSTQNPEHTYKLIMGSDNFDRFREWKDWQPILEEYRILVYRRPGYHGSDFEKHPHVKMFDNVPMIHISSTYIRASVHKKKSIRYLVPEVVRKYIEKKKLFIG